MTKKITYIRLTLHASSVSSCHVSATYRLKKNAYNYRSNFAADIVAGEDWLVEVLVLKEELLTEWVGQDLRISGQAYVSLAGDIIMYQGLS